MRGSYEDFKKAISVLNNTTGEHSPKISLVEDTEGDLVFITIRYPRALYRDRLSYKLKFSELSKLVAVETHYGLSIVSTKEVFLNGILHLAVNDQQKNWAYGNVLRVLQGVVDDLLKCQRSGGPTVTSP